jgi:hypothetical protein
MADLYLTEDTDDSAHPIQHRQMATGLKLDDALAICLFLNNGRYLRSGVEAHYATGDAASTGPIEGELFEGQFYPIVNPVRAAALHEAVRAAGNYWQPGATDPDGYYAWVLATAERFEQYLLGGSHD